MPSARKTDPETSKLAAASITAQRITETQLNVLLCMSWFVSTADAILVERFQDYWPYLASQSGIRSRRADLTAAGLIRDTGERITLRGNRSHILWEITPKGRKLLKARGY